MTSRHATRRGSLQPLVALRLAARALRRSSGTTAAAVVVLALGLALPSTFFSLLVGAIRPLPVPEGDRMVRVMVVQPDRGGRELAVTLEDARVAGLGPGAVSTLEGLGAFRTLTSTLVDRGVASTRVSAAALTPGTFELLRVPPLLGRIPGPSEAAETLLLGEEVWREVYAADPAALGRTVEVDEHARTIVGVMPDAFGFPFNQAAWTLIGPGDTSPEPVELFGRLASGATLEGATAELAARWRQADAERSPERTGGLAIVRPYTGSRGEGGEAIAFVGLVLIALCLLAIACSNVANLLLVRATERVRALGIQSALGAGRAQIGLQLFLEALIVAAVGGAAGLALAWTLVDTIQHTLSAEHFGYYWMRMAVDGPVLVFSTTLVVCTALMAGTLPITRVMRVDVQRVLREDDGSAAVGGGGRWSRAFVTAQLALSCAALVGAGLTGRTLGAVNDLAGDLPTERILVASVGLEGVDDSGGAVRALEAGLAGLPGVTHAAVAIGAPGYLEPWGAVELDGETYDRPEDRPSTFWTAVTPGYFGAFEQELRAGRALGPADAADGAPVAVVNESFVRRFGTDRAVVGRRLRIGDAEAWRTVVGVVSDAPLGAASGREGTMRLDRVYLPIAQVAAATPLLVARTSNDAAALTPEVRRMVGSVDARIALWSPRTLEDAHAWLTRVPRAMSLVAVGGGSAGLLVAAVGLYGLLAFRVRQRRRELGVRLALGANGRRLARETLVVAGRQLLPAVALGLSAAWLVSPILGAFLLGAEPRAPSTYVGVGAIFVGVGLIASALPALRAAATDPAEVLRGG